MEVKKAYNTWAEQYDTNENKTRDLEAISLKSTLSNVKFDSCLEIGCGTGKNTVWLISRANKVLAVDFSDQMLAKAKAKIQSDKVKFVQANILYEWDFTNNAQFDLVTFSLVLEHIENLDFIFEKLNKVVKPNGSVYIGELHPFKQYNGTKARFETESGLEIVSCYNHHISDFTDSAKKYGFEILVLNEFFDESNRNTIPRILTLLLRKAK
jgi:ubiquinone/menaquinone biosynthesis C-methylase UbiE